MGRTYINGKQIVDIQIADPKKHRNFTSHRSGIGHNLLFTCGLRLPVDLVFLCLGLLCCSKKVLIFLEENGSDLLLLIRIIPVFFVGVCDVFCRVSGIEIKIIEFPTKKTKPKMI